MSSAVTNLLKAQQLAMQNRPHVGGFPYLAETLKRFGVLKNSWTLPSCQSLYLTKDGPVVMQGTPLMIGTFDIPKFDEQALIKAIRIDQAGNSTFNDFLLSAWMAGVVTYEVDFILRTVTYYGCNQESYIEEYPQVTLTDF